MLGAQQVLNNYLTGDIAEVRIYNSVLSTTPRIYEERALKARYGISGGSAPRVPTDLAALADNHTAMLNWTMAAGAETYSIWRSTDGGTTYELIASGLTNSSYVDTFAVSEQDILYRVARRERLWHRNPNRSAFGQCTDAGTGLPGNHRFGGYVLDKLGG